MRLLILTAALVLIPGTALAASALLPIRVAILDCKTVKTAGKECRDNDRCCEVWERKKKEQGDDEEFDSGAQESVAYSAQEVWE